MESLQPNSVVRFGIFEVSLQSGEVRKASFRIRVQHQPMKLLEILLEHPGKLSPGRNCAGESGPAKASEISIRRSTSPSGSCGVPWETRLRIRDSSRLFRNVGIALSRTCQSSMQTPSRYFEEVFVIVRNRAKKTIFKLFTTPGIGKFNSLPGKCLSYRRHDRVGVKNNKIIERDRLKARSRWACRRRLAIEKKSAMKNALIVVLDGLKVICVGPVYFSDFVRFLAICQILVRFSQERCLVSFPANLIPSQLQVSCATSESPSKFNFQSSMPRTRPSTAALRKPLLRKS